MNENAHPGLNLGSVHGGAQRRSQRDAFGFWVFLMSDLIVVGILIAHYVVSEHAQAGGPGPGIIFDLTNIAFQTSLLLSSSFADGLGSLCLKQSAGTGIIVLWLILAAMLGGGFVTLEMRDFLRMIAIGAVPQRSAFLSALWTLVGLHGLHVIMGLLWIAVMLALIATQGFSDMVKSRFVLLGLYWHFLGIVWVGIFSLVFLGGLA